MSVIICVVAPIKRDFRLPKASIKKKLEMTKTVLDYIKNDA